MNVSSFWYELEVMTFPTHRGINAYRCCDDECSYLTLPPNVEGNWVKKEWAVQRVMSTDAISPDHVNPHYVLLVDRNALLVV